MKQLESKVQKDCVDWLRSKKVYVYRAMGNAMAAKGTPDVLCCIAGQFVSIEFKREYDGAYGVTKPQEVRMRQIRKAGGITAVIASLDDVKELYRSVVEDAV